MIDLRSLITMLLLTLGLAACAVNPATKHHDFVMMSESQELDLGRKSAAEISKSLPLLAEKDSLSLYVERIGQRMAAVSDRAELFYHFRVVDDDTINAFALPGGYIYLHRGLINHMNSEAELAAVLGHEIGHVTARHSVQQYSKAQAYQVGAMITSIFLPVPQAATMLSDMLATAVIKGYGREAELQSDELSVKYLSRAGFDPAATVGVLETLKRLSDLDNKEKRDSGEQVTEYHGAFASHPKTAKRIREAVAQLQGMQGDVARVNRNAILRAVDGYPYGDSPEQGAVVGQRFLHPELGIQLEFPNAWVMMNTPVSLNARLRQQDVYFQLRLLELKKKQTPAELLRASFPSRHTKVISTGSQAGMDFVHAEVAMSAPHVSEANIDVHMFIQDQRAFVMLMWSQRQDFYKHRKDFTVIANSFATYVKEKEGDIPRIALYTWRHGDGWKALAAKYHQVLGRFTAEKLAALNGMGIDEQPETGVLIKIVH